MNINGNRASTTAKITKSAIAAIHLSLAKKEGVIVRNNGVEYGVFATFGGVINISYRCISSFGETIESAYWLSKSTIRKGTVEAINAEKLKLAA